jgi:hypothetical protein
VDLQNIVNQLRVGKLLGLPEGTLQFVIEWPSARAGEMVWAHGSQRAADELGLYPHLRVSGSTRCNRTGEPIKWKGRRWPLSYHMTEGEVVQTAWLAIKQAVEHELREVFLYEGLSIFDPHYDIRKLLELRSAEESLRGREG